MGYAIYGSGKVRLREVRPRKVGLSKFQWRKFDVSSSLCPASLPFHSALSRKEELRRWSMQPVKLKVQCPYPKRAWRRDFSADIAV